MVVFPVQNPVRPSRPAGAVVSPAVPLGLVICLMPLRHESAEPRRRSLEEIFAGQGHALLCGDSGTIDQPEGRAAAAQALDGMIDAVDEDRDLGSLPLALLGIGPGAGPVLEAAATRRGRLRALAACGGRLQDALDALPRLRLPTLLVAGGADEAVAGIDRAALRRLPGAWRLEIVPGARGCLAEPGCFETAAHHAASWFSLHLVRH